MTIRFNGLELPGLHSTIQRNPPVIQVRRDKFWGNDGELELLGGQMGRQLTAEITLFDKWNVGKIDESGELINFLRRLDSLTKTNGTLEESGTIKQTFADCTFEGFTPTLGPLPDIANTLDGGWWIEGQLSFYQLRV